MVVTRSLSPDKWWATGHKLYFVVCSMWQWSSIIYLWLRPICCRIDRIGFVLNATTNHSQRAWMRSYICICVWVSVLSKRTTVQHAAILNTSKLENIAASYCSIVRYSSRRRKRKNISSFYADIVFSTLTSILSFAQQSMLTEAFCWMCRHMLCVDARVFHSNSYFYFLLFSNLYCCVQWAVHRVP